MKPPRLNRKLVLSPSFQAREDLVPPPETLFHLPERVLQFGSGRFLRGFTDSFIDRANREGSYQGRVVIVQSTGEGRRDLLHEQDGLYTLWLRGLVAGQRVDSIEVISAVSRTLGAAREWERVLECARSPDLEVVVSNTTELGLVLDPEDRLELDPPRSYPGKLTAVLFERFRSLDGDPGKGLVVIPCELVDNNGAVLRDLVRELARRWKLGAGFERWLDEHNVFCSSLVDRIVTGNPALEELPSLEKRLGYRDEMLVVAEVYSLWAIRGEEAVRRRLGFARANPSVQIAEDIQPFRERKIRILNGTHTVSAPVAYLTGKQTVLEALEDPLLAAFVEGLMREEIAPTLEVDPDTVPRFIAEVLDRFRNPFLKHRWVDITWQSTSKLRIRVLPTLLRYQSLNGALPRRVCFGFAAHLAFMRGVEEREGLILGRLGSELYPINDDHAPFYLECWREAVPAQESDAFDRLVRRVCARTELWGRDLSEVPGFAARVREDLERILSRGVEASLKSLLGEPF